MAITTGLQLVCLLAAAALALALVLVSARSTGVSAQAVRTTAAAPAPHFTIYQQHCMERILARPVIRTDKEVAHLIDQLCFAPFRVRGSAEDGVPPCDRLLGTWFMPPVKPAAACRGF
jgi:hypothetical protein